MRELAARLRGAERESDGIALDGSSEDPEQKLLKAQIKAALLGGVPEPVRLGRFEVIRCLGRGGHGAVYEARDGAGASVALKLIEGASAESAAVQREFRALRRVAHPNLVVLHELFHVDQRWFFTMELVAGVDFLRYARAEPSAVALRRAFAQLLAGLHALHSARKVHRDLKPSNVLVDAAGRLTILDYGLLVDQDALIDGDRDNRAGTPSYMAPEQRAGKGVGPAADLYAAGKMLSEALQQRAAADDTLTVLCAELLADAPERRPSAERALAHLRGSERVSCHEPPRATLAHEPFVGRERELDALVRALGRAREGVACAVWLHGPSGIGKSALLREFAALSRGQGALVLEGRCYERENASFKVFDGAIASLVRQLQDRALGCDPSLLPSPPSALTRLFPELARLPGVRQLERDACGDLREQQKVAFAALRELLARLSSLRPVVLLLDDLQWGDADSARLFGELLALPGAPALLSVGAFRSDERLTSPFLRPLFEPHEPTLAGCEVVDIAVPHLTVQESQTLLYTLQPGARAWAPATMSASIRDARGVPFLLHELSAEQGAAGQDPSSRLEQRVLARARGCSPAAQTLLEVLCVAAQPLALSLATHAAELSKEGWASAHELCVQRLARWRDTDGERCVEPYHDIVRELVTRAGEPERMRRVHLQLARSYGALAGEQLEQQLFHWRGAGDAGRAYGFALAAAERAERSFAWIHAAELYRTALDLTAPQNARAGLFESLARVLSCAAQHGAAAEAYRSAAAAAPRARALELRRLAAAQLLLAGRSVEGAEQMHELLRDVGVRYPRDRAAAKRLLVLSRLRLPFARAARRVRGVAPAEAAQEARHAVLRAAGATLFLTDPWGAVALHSLYLAEVRGTGTLHELHALAWEVGQRAVYLGRAGERSVAPLLRTMRSIVARHAAPYDRAIALLAEAAYDIHCQEQLERALATIERADALLMACLDTQFERGCAAAGRIDLLFMLGDARFQHEARGREREYLGRADGYSLQQLQLVVPALRLLEDRPDLALAFLTAHWPDRGRVDDLFDYFAFGRRCEALLYQDGAQAAYDVVQRHWPALMRHSAQPLFAAERAFHRARVAAALYASNGQRALRAEALRYSVPGSYTPRVGFGLFNTVHASIAASDRDQDEAQRRLEAAIGDFVVSQHQHFAWVARYRLAQLTGDGATLTAAQRWFAEFGVQVAERWVQAIIPWPR